jgi:hypothetical protein
MRGSDSEEVVKSVEVIDSKMDFLEDRVSLSATPAADILQPSWSD